SHSGRVIFTQSWAMLSQDKSDLHNTTENTGIASSHSYTPAQVVMAWHLAHGIVTIPKSVTPSRIVENLEAADVKLTEEEVAAIDALDRPDGRGGFDPAQRRD